MDDSSDVLDLGIDEAELMKQVDVAETEYWGSPGERGAMEKGLYRQVRHGFAWEDDLYRSCYEANFDIDESELIEHVDLSVAQSGVMEDRVGDIGDGRDVENDEFFQQIDDAVSREMSVGDGGCGGSGRGSVNIRDGDIEINEDGIIRLINEGLLL